MEIVDQIIINASGHGAITRYYELKAAGYVVAWCGEGKICFRKYA